MQAPHLLSTLKTAARRVPRRRYASTVPPRATRSPVYGSRIGIVSLQPAKAPIHCSCVILQVGAIAAAGLAYFYASPKVRLDAPPPKNSSDKGHKPERSDLISYTEVQNHNKPDDLWVIINGKVYDLTNFVALHPGGPDHLTKSAGKEVSALFNVFHPPGTIEDSETLPETALKGFVDPETLPEVPQANSPQSGATTEERKQTPLAAIVGVPDLEVSTAIKSFSRLYLMLLVPSVTLCRKRHKPFYQRNRLPTTPPAQQTCTHWHSTLPHGTRFSSGHACLWTSTS